MENFVAAATPGGIEAQEKRGQIEQSFLETLPKDLGQRFGRDAKPLLEKLGFRFGGDYDDLFFKCEFPTGWRKKPTEHSMWSEIVDEKGRKRGMIFYKAAFYDRSAHAHLEARFGVSKYEDTGTKGERAVAVTDCGGTLETFGTYKDGEYAKGDALAAKAVEWLKKNYPDYENPLAYWD